MMVLVRDFGFSVAIMMVAFRFGNFVAHMFNLVRRLEHDRKQYGKNDRKAEYGKTFFHQSQM